MHRTKSTQSAGKRARRAHVAHRSATDKAAPTDQGDADDATGSNGQGRDKMIAEAAYYRALNRGFNGGNPDEDWFAAEREIDQRYGVSH